MLDVSQCGNVRFPDGKHTFPQRETYVFLEGNVKDVGKFLLYLLVSPGILFCHFYSFEGSRTGFRNLDFYKIADSVVATVEYYHFILFRTSKQLFFGAF